MPAVPTVAHGFQHPSTMLTSVPSSDVKALLTDTLLSFSPLATLVGADAVRSLAHRSTNLKQSFAMSLAPIGTLGMIATVCKASNFSSLKHMLGVSEQNIHDAAREVGCGVAIGRALPRMDQFGDLISDLKEEDYSQAAHAIVRFKWKTALEQKHLNFDPLRWITENFAGATISGRVRWKMQSEDALEVMVSRVEEILRRSSHGFAMDAFEGIHQLNDGRGMIELSWPAPAMSLETMPRFVTLYLVLFSIAFLLNLVIPDARHRGLPVVGLGLLVIGHWSARILVQKQRLTLCTSIPRMRPAVWNSWMLVDKPRFPTILARRPFLPAIWMSEPARKVYLSSPNLRFTLSQYHQFKRLHTSPVPTILTLIGLCAGFFTFYLGVKSSNLNLVVPLLIIYFLANLSKGWISRYTNSSYQTPLNNPGHPRVDKPYSEFNEVQLLGKRVASQHHAGQDGNNVELGAAAEAPSPSQDALAIYCKFQARDRKGIMLFCFSSPHEWIIAARIIMRTIKPFLASSPSPIEGPERPESLLRVPIYSWRSKAREGESSHDQARGLLLMAIENIKPDELFWSVGMEIAMIVLDNYQSPRLCSEHKDAMYQSLLGSVVYSCTRMLLSAICDGVQPNTKQLGVRILLRSIEEVANGISNPRQDIQSIIPTLRAAANSAITGSAARLPTQAHPAPQGQALDVSNAGLDEFSQLARLRSKKLNDLDKVSRKLMAYIDVMANERWTSLPPFKPCWAEDLKACEHFRNLELDGPGDAGQQSQAVPPEESEEQELDFESLELPEQRAVFKTLLLQELRWLKAYQESGLTLHHRKLLAPAQREWLEKLLVFQHAIQPPLPSAPLQPGVQALPIDSQFDEQSQQLWRLYRLPRLQQLQYLRDLQAFLHFLQSGSQDTYSPFQKQVDIAVKCAEQMIAYLTQAPFKPWATIQRLNSFPLLYLFSVFCIGLEAFVIFLIHHSNSKLLVSLIGVFFFFYFLVLVVCSIKKVSFIHPKLAYAMSYKNRLSCREQDRGEAQTRIVLTEGHAMRTLIHELELLRVETIKRRAPLLVALLEERGDWDQIDEHERENNGRV